MVISFSTLQLFLISTLFLAAPTLGSDCSSGDFPVRWVSGKNGMGTKELLERRRNLKLAKEELRALILEKGASAKNTSQDGALSCYDFGKENPALLGSNEHGEWFWNGGSWEGSQFLRDCITLHLVEKAKAAGKSCLAGFQLEPASGRVLPSTLGLIASTPAERGMAELKSLASWAPQMKFRLDDGELVGKVPKGRLAQEDHFSLVAFGDFDGDGYQDILMSVRNISTGTYGELRLAVLSRKKMAGLLSHVRVAQ